MRHHKLEELPPEFREWVIESGHGAYVALYHYDRKQILTLVVRHGCVRGTEGRCINGGAQAQLRRSTVRIFK
jgi:hypothetical protein